MEVLTYNLFIARCFLVSKEKDLHQRFSAVFSNLLEFGEHLLIKLNKSSLILKNNPTYNLEFYFFREHLMKAQGALVVPRAVAGKWEPQL